MELGAITLLFNIVIFGIACGLLFGSRMYPTYKLLLLMVAVGVLFVNIHCILRWHWFRSNIKKLEQMINANIVATTCPEYWSKVRKCSPNNKCYEQCANIPLVKQDEIFDEDNKKYKIYSDKDVAFPLEWFNNMTNQQKCWLVGNDFPTPWMELSKKCEAAHV